MTRVLIVEDNEMNRDMLTRRLERKGFSIVTAEDGEAALLAINTSQPDIVLMDMNLPVLSGWATCRELRNHPDTKQLPIIALTAHAMAGDREKAIEAGCDDYATKPIDFPALLEKIARLLEARQ